MDEFSASVQVNTRLLHHEQTGVQRYTAEVLKRLDGRVDQVRPTSFPGGGIPGHLWEQFVLPFCLDDRLFWNPTCPGPVAVSNQVVTVHDLSAIEHPEWFDWKYAIWNRLLVPILLRRVRHVITVSNYTQDRVHDLFGVSRAKMTTIPNGVDARFSPPPASEIDRMRNALDLPDRPYLLSLSALQPRKNVQRLLHAWREMRPRLSEPVTLVLAGGAGRPTIFHGFSLDSIPDDVVFTEYVDDALLPALYGGAQAFVYPSLYEGFGLPVLEAMACGTPVVTSNVTSMPEIAGDAALLVSPFSVSSIADGLYAILTNTDLRDRLRERGRERAASFSWETTASETLALLQSKSGSRRPSASTK